MNDYVRANRLIQTSIADKGTEYVPVTGGFQIP